MYDVRRIVNYDRRRINPAVLPTSVLPSRTMTPPWARLICLLAAAAFTQPSTRLQAQQIDTASALAALRDASTACHLDAGRLWGISLCAPIALTDRATRLVIATDSVSGRPFLPYVGAFLTTAPEELGFANTSFTWGTRSWAMILLPLPADRFDRASLVMHEVFHSVQDTLHLAGSDPANNQLDVLEGRHLLRLELRALAAALDALSNSGADVRAHTSDALLFRAQRHALYPAADSLEPALEMQEGLAEYTGDRLAMMLTGEPATRIAPRVRAFQSNPTYVRSFAYATGPALGILLDHFSPTWRRDVRTTRNPALLLARAIGFHAPIDLARAVSQRAKSYGDAEIMSQELARDSTRRVRMADYRKRLVDGPTVTFRQTNLSRGFNPQTLVGFDSVWTIYPTGNFSADWGSLDVKDGGAIVASDFRTLRVAAPGTPITPEMRAIHGSGWTLTIAPSWSLRPVAGRAGSYEAAKNP